MAISGTAGNGNKAAQGAASAANAAAGAASQLAQEQVATMVQQAIPYALDIIRDAGVARPAQQQMVLAAAGAAAGMQTTTNAPSQLTIEQITAMLQDIMPQPSELQTAEPPKALDDLCPAWRSLPPFMGIGYAIYALIKEHCPNHSEGWIAVFSNLYFSLFLQSPAMDEVRDIEKQYDVGVLADPQSRANHALSLFNNLVDQIKKPANKNEDLLKLINYLRIQIETPECFLVISLTINNKQEYSKFLKLLDFMAQVIRSKHTPLAAWNSHSFRELGYERFSRFNWGGQLLQDLVSEIGSHHLLYVSKIACIRRFGELKKNCKLKARIYDNNPKESSELLEKISKEGSDIAWHTFITSIYQPLLKAMLVGVCHATTVVSEIDVLLREPNLMEERETHFGSTISAEEAQMAKKLLENRNQLVPFLFQMRSRINAVLKDVRNTDFYMRAIIVDKKSPTPLLNAFIIDVEGSSIVYNTYYNNLTPFSAAFAIKAVHRADIPIVLARLEIARRKVLKAVHDLLDKLDLRILEEHKEWLLTTVRAFFTTKATPFINYVRIVFASSFFQTGEREGHFDDFDPENLAELKNVAELDSSLRTVINFAALGGLEEVLRKMIVGKKAALKAAAAPPPAPPKPLEYAPAAAAANVNAASQTDQYESDDAQASFVVPAAAGQGSGVKVSRKEKRKELNAAFQAKVAKSQVKEEPGQMADAEKNIEAQEGTTEIFSSHKRRELIDLLIQTGFKKAKKGHQNGSHETYDHKGVKVGIPHGSNSKSISPGVVKNIREAIHQAAGAGAGAGHL